MNQFCKTGIRNSKLPLYCFAAILFSSSSFAQVQKDSTNDCRNITRKEILEAKAIVDVLGFPKDEFEIVSYQLTIVGKGKNLLEFSSAKDLHIQMEEEIKKLVPGDKFYFEYIKLRRKNKEAIRSVPPICFIIIGK